MKATAKLTADIKAAASLEGCLLVDNVTGFAYYPNGTPVHFGVGTDDDGGGDLIGLTSDGIFVSIEVKIGKDYRKPNQLKWHKWVKLRNGRSGISRTVEDARNIWRGISEGSPK